MKPLPLIYVSFALCSPVSVFAQTSPTPSSLTAPTPAELLTAWLERLEFSTENLCAAGVTTQTIGAFVTHAENVRQTLEAQLAAADTELAEARADLRAQLAQIDATPQQRAAAAATAKLRVQQAQQAVDSLLAAAHTQATSELPEDAQITLRTLRANAGRALPTAYQVVERTPAEWAGLQRALRDKRVKESLGQTTEPTAASVIASADAAPRVVAAKSRLLTADAVRAAREAAIASAAGQ